MDALILNSERRHFRYEWNGGATVNVHTKVGDEWVNFDVFTNHSIKDATFYDICKNHMKDREESDPRYLGDHTREEYMYGVME